MAYIQEEGDIQLKVVGWSPFQFPSGDKAIKFDFVDKDNRQVDGTISFLKRDGEPNENIQIFSEAFESGKSLLCFVAQGKEKQGGGHFYSVKWAATPKIQGSTDVKSLMDYIKGAKSNTPKPSVPSDDIPF